jgi:hypothetical protein
MSQIKQGDLVEVVTADGQCLRRRAISGPCDGDDFRVVWVCREEIWATESRPINPITAMAWPIEAVRRLE